MRNLLVPTSLLACLVLSGCPKDAGSAAGAGEPGPHTQAAPPPPAADVPRLTAARVADADMKLDGKLDEPAWARCGATGPLVSPGHGRPDEGSRVQGQAKVCWSENKLYVAVTVADAQPVSPFKREDVDPHLWERSSAVELMIQPGDPGDNRTYYEVQVDTHEAVWDTRFDDYNFPVSNGPDGQRLYGHQDWDARLERAVAVDSAKGQYVVEMALPWASLSSTRTAVPPNPGDTWRVNVYTFRDGQADALAWSPLLGRGNFHRAARFGRVVFAGP